MVRSFSSWPHLRLHMFLVYFIIIMHHRTRHGYARSLTPILHLIHSLSHLHIATTMTSIATIKTTYFFPFAYTR